MPSIGGQLGSYLFGTVRVSESIELKKRLQVFTFLRRKIMADDKPVAGAAAPDDEDEVTPGYKAPKMVDLDTIQKLDQDDESLVKYKQQLLGQTAGVKDEGGSNVIVKQMIIAPEGRDEIVIDLDPKNLSKLKEVPTVMKEGCVYRVKVVFRVQREIVAGLRYAYQTYRKGIRVDKANLMVGSYGPKTEPHVFTTPPEDAPSGMISRGNYTVKSKFTDDDKNSILEWEWALKIAKDW